MIGIYDNTSGTLLQALPHRAALRDIDLTRFHADPGGWTAYEADNPLPTLAEAAQWRWPNHHVQVTTQLCVRLRDIAIADRRACGYVETAALEHVAMGRADRHPCVGAAADAWRAGIAAGESGDRLKIRRRIYGIDEHLHALRGMEHTDAVIQCHRLFAEQWRLRVAIGDVPDDAVVSAA